MPRGVRSRVRAVSRGLRGTTALGSTTARVHRDTDAPSSSRMAAPRRRRFPPGLVDRRVGMWGLAAGDDEILPQRLAAGFAEGDQAVLRQSLQLLQEHRPVEVIPSEGGI